MQILKIDLQNCYGIAKLNTEFDFKAANAKIVYAPNGCMKTSFAKTMDVISKGKFPSDEIFPERESVYSISIDESEITPGQILVFKTYSDTYSSKDKMTSLLVNLALKKRYDEILDSIEKKKNDLFKNIKGISSSSNAEFEINTIFRKKTIFESLEFIRDEVNRNDFAETNFKYGDIINSKVQDFLKANSALISDYLEKYTELVSASTVFEKGIFGTENASVVTKSLNDNRFFEAKT